MAILYEQFLGSTPGIRVELVDDSKSPYLVKTLDGFEFLISAEDFRHFYKEAGTPTPDVWHPFFTDPAQGFVDANKMTKVMEAMQPFEKIFQNFPRARSFVRDALMLTQKGSDARDNSIKDLVEKYTRASVNLGDVKREVDKLNGIDSEIKALLIDESRLNFSIGIGHIDKPAVKRVPESEAPHSVTSSETIRKRQPAHRGGNLKNVDMKVEGNVLTITIDLSRDFGPSKSGKTIIIASTEGNKSVPGKEHQIGLNVYKKLEMESRRGTRKSFKNVEIEVEESILTINIDLTKEFGPSKSGKTIIVASTEGNQLIYGRNERIGLNVYRRIGT